MRRRSIVRSTCCEQVAFHDVLKGQVDLRPEVADFHEGTLEDAHRIAMEQVDRRASQVFVLPQTQGLSGVVRAIQHFALQPISCHAGYRNNPDVPAAMSPSATPGTDTSSHVRPLPAEQQLRQVLHRRGLA